MAKLHVLDHPLIQHKLTLLRDRRTEPAKFRPLMEQLARLLAYEALRTLPTVTTTVETPVAQARSRKVEEDLLCLVPILRAGLGMAEGILQLVPRAKVGHVGLFRHSETLRPVKYYAKLPAGLDRGPILLLDPMLATGGSAAAAANLIKEAGGRDLTFVCIVAAPEGVALFQAAHPDVPLYTAAVDERLNAKAYIVPGLGDAGDRLYGTF